MPVQVQVEVKLVGRTFWDLSSDLIPLPKRKMRCPICGCDVIWFKSVSVVRRPTGYRADVSVKCNDCGLVQTFGVHITDEEYRRFIEHWGGTVVEYFNVGHININERW